MPEYATTDISAASEKSIRRRRRRRRHEMSVEFNREAPRATAQRGHSENMDNGVAAWCATEKGHVNISSMPWYSHAPRQRDAFTKRFLRLRAALAVQEIVKEVRTLMRSCCLPTIDVDVLEKYIISPLEHGGRRGEKTSLLSTSLSGEDAVKTCETTPCNLYENITKKGSFSTDILETRSPCVTSVPTVKPACNHDDDSGVNDAAVGPLFTPVTGGTHSRHPVCHEALSNHEKKRMLAEKRSKFGHCVSNRLNANSYKHVAKTFLGSRPSPIGAVDDVANSVRGMEAVGRNEAAVADIMQLRRLLLEHQAQTLAVLDAVEQRETIVSKLRDFLAMAASDLGTGAVSTEMDDESNGDTTQRRGSHMGLPRRRSLPGQLQPSVVPRRPVTFADDAVAVPSRIGALVKKRRYYRRGVLYFMHQLQRISVVLLHAVRSWRKSLSGNYPFVVKGHNYLLRMALEMADFSKEPTLLLLFPSGTGPKRRMRVTKGSIEMDLENVFFPESLQYFPLLSNMPNLAEYRKPPAMTTSGSAAAFASSEKNLGREREWFLPLTRTACAGEVYRRQKPFSKGVPADVAYLRCVRAAEVFLHREVCVQMKLLWRNFIACAEGRYPPLLRGVGELCGSRDKMVRLQSRRWQHKWYRQLNDMLSCLEMGSSALCRD
ncbi:hypothetical protein C3747_78g104 [Trypanosoma cruzi]|uniref:Uncharacterized protein n=2 Tax=Trypanosoma cruzi TaxID=5693 RepID=Q4E5Q9_TRYCC|nr:hypothetical protein, conserved [Trypanosoma cruzi]EAO00102.1 hypothetical protein, conserved [Trypanosoma cruzi]PWV09522.1 hypothetical protein C3747_78g104 [Trypanosoma cruzi]|eukprot:XP_821953.1 hypothetical protein [Trypanosoma cruzi strain CL Brener]